MRGLTRLGGALVALTAGCMMEEEALEIEEVEQHSETSNGVSINGVSINGVSINGVSINGVSINGVSINGVSINGVSINGVSINGVSINGGQLAGMSADGQPLSGADLIGARFSGTRSDGGGVTMRIDDAQALAGTNADVWGYRVAYSLDDTTWSPLCTNGGLAVAIAGRWSYESDVPGAGGWIDDPSSFTFGCRGAALAKCVELGYKPWRSAGGVDLRDHHTACVRMIRGDYCGDGHAWTQDGNRINVHDLLGIQADSTTWTVDAGWDENGATCAKRSRALTMRPPCYSAIVDGNCGFESGALIMSEYGGAGAEDSLPTR